MSRAAAALIGIAVLIAAGQVLVMRLANLVDLRLMPSSSRRHVQWMVHNSTHILLGCGSAALVGVAVQTATVV